MNRYRVIIELDVDADSIVKAGQQAVSLVRDQTRTYVNVLPIDENGRALVEHDYVFYVDEAPEPPTTCWYRHLGCTNTKEEGSDFCEDHQ